MADLEPPVQQAVELPSGEADRGRDGSSALAVELLQQVLTQLGELLVDIGRLPVDSEIAATYCNSAAHASVGWGENLLDLGFFWKAYLPIENILNGKRPRISP